jgi:hypothetical protein
MLSSLKRRLLLSGLAVGLLHPVSGQAADEVLKAPRQSDAIAKSHNAAAGSADRLEVATAEAKTLIVKGSAAIDVVQSTKPGVADAKVFVTPSTARIDVAPTRFNDVQIAPQTTDQKKSALQGGTPDAQEKIESRDRAPERKQIDTSNFSNKTENDVRTAPPQSLEKRSATQLLK